MEQELNLLLVVGAPLDPVPSQEKLRQLLTDARVVWGPKASRGTDQIIYKRFLGEVPNMEKAFADGNEAQVSAIAANALKVARGGGGKQSDFRRPAGSYLQQDQEAH